MSKTLLLADDSITIQKVVGITFANEDYQIVCVDNGEDAVAKAAAIKPHIILADVVMPKMDGYQVCEKIKSDPQLRHIPVLLLTGAFKAFDEERSRKAGADGHIAKPFDSQALIDKVKELISRPPQHLPRLEPQPPVPAPLPPVRPVPQTSVPRMPTVAPATMPFQVPSPMSPPPPPPVPTFAAPSPFKAPLAPSVPPPAIPATPPASAPRVEPAPFSSAVFSSPSPSKDPFATPRERSPLPTSPTPSPTPLTPSFGQSAESAEIPDFGMDFGAPQPMELSMFEGLSPSPQPEPIQPQAVPEGLWDVPTQEAIPPSPVPPSVKPEMPSFLTPAITSSGSIAPFGEAFSQDPFPNFPGLGETKPVEPPSMELQGNLGQPAAWNTPTIAPLSTPMPTPAPEVPAVETADLHAIPREIIEKIAWEIVPDLAESIIREEIERLKKEKGVFT